jgi:sugar phosphate isomerase/epimerase
MCLPTSVDALKPVLENAVKFGVDHINAQPNIRPRSFGECVDILEGWLRLGQEAGIPVYIETHRDRMTNDLFLTLDLLKVLPELRLTADLSHYVVSREFPYPLRDDNQADVRAILDRSHAFHGRVAGPGQIQLPISFPHNRAWVDIFLGWWEYGFRSWLDRSHDGDILTFTCELGPRPYAIVKENGDDLADRWQEALLLRTLVRNLWDRIHDRSDGTVAA